MDGYNDLGYPFYLATLLVMAVSLFFALHLREWIELKPPEDRRRYRMSARSMLIAISFTPLLLSVATPSAWAKDLPTLALEATSPHDVIDSEIVQPDITLTTVPSAMELGLFESLSHKTRLYRRFNNVEMAITLDLARRTSLTNRLISTPVKIDWHQSNLNFKERRTVRETKAFMYMSRKVHPINLSRAAQVLPQTYVSHLRSFPQPRSRPTVPAYFRDSNQQVLAQFLHLKSLPRTQTPLLPSSSPWDREYMPLSIVLDVHELLGA
ncbi:MAG: hypothetical protein ACPGYT_00795 [Nitrospirales bacterium]